MITYRDLTSLEEFGKVVELEAEIWGPGYTDVVPTPILGVSVHRGGILIGAFAEERPTERDPATSSGSARAESRAEHLIGFVYSLPGIKDGKATQWSHMLGVIDRYRSDGIGFQLKMLQRERTLAMGLDLIEWTYDPMQAMNAHLNFTKLGVVVSEYLENAYGDSASPLHKGNPTDRFVAEWWVRQPRRTDEFAGAVPANELKPAGDWFECVSARVDLEAPKVSVVIPMGFTGMLSRAPDLALEWRLQTRKLFVTYFNRGYQAVAFALDRPNRRGCYLLIKTRT